MGDLFQVFHSSATRYPGYPALEIRGRNWTYTELEQLALSLAGVIYQADVDPRPVAAFLAYRSLEAYVSVLGILAAGKGYVPLHPQFPAQRTRTMLERSGANLLIVDAERLPVLTEVLAGVSTPLTVICLEFQPPESLVQKHPSLRFVSVNLQTAPPAASTPAAPDSIAYLLFTSGSTGVPKGVPIRQRNISAYLDYMRERYQIGPADRCSQTFDMTFDPSLHDMFVTWGGGACLCCVPPRSVIAPSKFIRDSALTVWYSVPSIAVLMQRMKMLKAGVFPNLRISLFSGEALLASTAAAWQEAACNSVVENLYGPTEASVNVTYYRWRPEDRPEDFLNGVVPIGTVYPALDWCMIDADRRLIESGGIGELCISGAQVCDGYLNDEQKTRQQFVRIPGKGAEVWYRTGDLVKEDPERGALLYLGRIDDQIQVQGYRVELQEVDAALRRAAGTEAAMAVAWPVHEGRADAVYGFVSVDGPLDIDMVKTQCAAVLPHYMVPTRIFAIEQIPHNSNGKFDRKALAARLEQLTNGA